MPTEKKLPSCPGSRDLNWTGKGLKSENFLASQKGLCSMELVGWLVS
jgi:hypothetical protein